MEAVIIPFFKALLLVPVTLLPIINPLSTAPIFAATVGGNAQLSARLARQVAINSWYVIVVSMLIGVPFDVGKQAASGFVPRTALVLL